jgi:hypothetical protein
MANVATALPAIPVALNSNYGGYSKVTPVVCTFDTTASDLTIYTPTATNYAAIVGIVYEDASAHSLVFTSGSTVLVTLERTTFEGLSLPIGMSGPLIVGKFGEALKIQCVTAAVSSMLVYVAEFSQLTFTK